MDDRAAHPAPSFVVWQIATAPACLHAGVPVRERDFVFRQREAQGYRHLAHRQLVVVATPPLHTAHSKRSCWNHRHFRPVAAGGQQIRKSRPARTRPSAVRTPPDAVTCAPSVFAHRTSAPVAVIGNNRAHRYTEWNVTQVRVSTISRFPHGHVPGSASDGGLQYSHHHPTNWVEVKGRLKVAVFRSDQVTVPTPKASARTARVFANPVSLPRMRFLFVGSVICRDRNRSRAAFGFHLAMDTIALGWLFPLPDQQRTCTA